MLRLIVGRALLMPLNAAYGFARPAVLQYLHWLGAALAGDLGRSYTTRESVAAIIAVRFPVTIELSLWSISLAVIRQWLPLCPSHASSWNPWSSPRT